FQPRRYIHAVAEDVVLFDDHVAEIDADAEPDAPVLGHLRLALDHPPLDLHGTSDGIHHARELGQEPVAGVLHDPAAVLRDRRIDQSAEVSFQALVRSLLICTHKARIARNIGGEDCGEAADRGHLSRGGRSNLTKCNAKTTPTLASRWPEDVQTSGAARHISARRSPRRLQSPPPGRFPPPCSGLIPRVSGAERDGSPARLVVSWAQPASTRTTKTAASHLRDLNAGARLIR